MRAYSRGTVSVLWLKMSGPASTTVRTASRSPWKSGVSTSIEVVGLRRRMARIVRAKISAPPSRRSSLSTEVTTAWRSPSSATDSATRTGSPRSSSVGRPEVTAQNRQALVHTSPRIMKVAVRRFQQSKMLGQRASSQTVCRRRSLTSCLSSRKFSPSWTRTRIHSGILRPGSMVWVMGCSLHADGGGGPALQALLDEAQEPAGRHPVDDPVVEREAHVHDVPNRDPLADHHRPAHDRLGGQDGGLGLVDDGLAGDRAGGPGV